MSVPKELVILALVGIGGFGLGLLLRRRPKGQEIEPIEPIDLGGRTAIASPAFASVLRADEPIARETAATLAAASQAIQEMQLLPTCPQCGKRMEMRIFKEKKIWVCDDFPGCRGARMADA